MLGRGPKGGAVVPPAHAGWLERPGRPTGGHELRESRQPVDDGGSLSHGDCFDETI
jgi:hypothetical protein